MYFVLQCVNNEQNKLFVMNMNCDFFVFAIYVVCLFVFVNACPVHSCSVIQGVHSFGYKFLKP